MKIVRLSTYHAAPRWLFLKIETDEGLTGIGDVLGAKFLALVGGSGDAMRAPCRNSTCCDRSNSLEFRLVLACCSRFCTAPAGSPDRLWAMATSAAPGR